VEPAEGRPVAAGALALLFALVAVGVFLSAKRPMSRRAAPGSSSRQQEGMLSVGRLGTKADALLGELVRLERDRQAGGIGADVFARRRDEIMAALEHLYASEIEQEGAPSPSSSSY
jgi:hypothetical protein